MTLRLCALLAVLCTTAACTERLTTPGACPALCPGGEVAIRDTVIEATVGADSSFTGFNGITDGALLLLSTGRTLGESRAVVRFIGRGDSLFIGDTVRQFSVDSVQINIFLVQRDSTINGMVLEVFRLPRTIDTLATVAEVDAHFSPQTLLLSLPLIDAIQSGQIPIPLQGADLAKLAFAPEDSTQLVIGIRLRPGQRGAAKVGGLRSGSLAASFTTFVDIGGADTATQKQSISRAPARDFTVREPRQAPGPDLLPVGGFPNRRAFIRFALPEFLRDSATILRATLELTGAAATVGIPGDSVRIDVRGLLADFGLKSPVVGDQFAATFLRTGERDVTVDIADLVTLWQGAAPLPSALRLQVGDEWGTFLHPEFFSTTGTGPGPRIRITYRPSFPFQGF